MLGGGRYRAREVTDASLAARNMVTIPRLLANDEELGKKDDDHKPGKGYGTASWRSPLRYRKRRVLVAFVIGVVVWLFVHNAPTDLGGQNRRWGDLSRSGKAHSAGQPAAAPTEPIGPPLRGPEDLGPEAGSRYYNGLIRYWRLASSLHSISRTRGYGPTNRDVLFAVSSLKSASVLLPMACEMARWERNYLHMVFTGRDNIPLEDILEINGVDKESCAVKWHDARPDYSEYSSDSRARSSVAAAMSHLEAFVRPQVIIIDDSLREDAFFVKAVRAKAKELGHPVIELPQDSTEQLMWMTRLDAGSLKAWHSATVDILIHAHAGSSGSLIRLIKSLESANYAGCSPPRLIIELPTEIDPPTKHFLENLVWPPNQERDPVYTKQLILRHRIPNQRVSGEEASVRFVESFYPANPGDSHVLLLSPQAQLSPSFYHYLKYHLLEYKYSFYGAMNSEDLLGVSLEHPSVYLNGTAPFVPPAADSLQKPRYKTGPADTATPFLWQAPNSNAALYFGDKWIELHSFLSNRLTAHHSKNRSPARSKLISPSLPAWTEYFLELMRARGYSLLYPGALTDTLVTIHNELYQPPEEFAPLPSSAVDDKLSPPQPNDEPFLTPTTPTKPPHHSEHPLAPASRPLHILLPFAGDLPELTHLPQLDYAGNAIDPERAVSLAEGTAAAFRREIGGCIDDPKGRTRKVTPGSARDLFCFGDNEDEYIEETGYEVDLDEVEARRIAAADEGSRVEATTTPSAEGMETATAAAATAKSETNTAREAFESRVAAAKTAQAAMAHEVVDLPAAVDASVTTATGAGAEVTGAATAATSSETNTARLALESRLAARASAIAAKKREEEAQIRGSLHEP